MKSRSTIHIAILYLSLIFSSAFNVIAQTPTTRFQHIGIEDGLSQNAVMDICQDSTGFLWIATNDGLNRYNGYELKIYRNNFEDSSSINSNIIKKLMVDSKDRLWISTDNGGLSLYQKESDNFKNFSKEFGDIKFTISSNIYEDKNGLIWFAVDKIGLIKFNPENYNYKVFSILKKSNRNIFSSIEGVNDELWITTRDSGLVMFSLSQETISRNTKDFADNLGLELQTRTIGRGTCGNIFVGTLNGIFQYNFETDRFFEIKIDKWDSKYAEVSNLIVSDSVLWFGSKSNGLFQYNLKTKSLKVYDRNTYSKFALSYSYVSSLFCDREKNIWIGTYGGGLDKMNENLAFKLYTHNARDSFSLANPSSRQIIQDRFGKVYVASYAGVRIFNNKTKTAYNLPYSRSVELDKKTNKSLLSISARALYLENDSLLWIGLEGTGVQKFNFNTNSFQNFSLESANSIQFKSNFVSNLSKGKKGAIWAATLDGLYKKDSLANKFEIFSLDESKEPEVLNLFHHPNGAIFIASQHGLYFNYKDKTQLIKCPEPTMKNAPCLLNSKLTSILALNDSTLIIGSAGNGIIEFRYTFEADSLRVKRYTPFQNDIIHTQTVYGILSQNDSIVWFSTNTGLYNYNIFTNAVSNFTYKDGLQENEFNYTSYYKANDGEMYFGGISGVNSFYPEEIGFENKINKVYFDHIQFGNKHANNLYYNGITSLRIPYDNNNISVEYFGLNLNRPDNINYFVQLIGLDQEPIFRGKQREVSYFNLAPGKYELRVWASNLNTIDNEDNFESIDLVIVPPIYLRLWFKTILGVLVLALFIVLIQYRMARLKKDKKELKREIEYRKKQIENQTLENEITISKMLIKGQHIEQKRISEELHDGIGHLLTAASLNISAIQNTIEKENWKVLPKQIDYVKEILDQSISEIRNVSHNLMPNLLAQEGLESAISEFVLRIKRSSRIDIKFNCDLNLKIDDEMAISLFRMIQEIVNNSLRHAQAKQIEISIHTKNNAIITQITDDGIGFDTNSPGNFAGQGLRNLKARTEFNRGIFKIFSSKEKGTKIIIQIPL